MGNNLYRPSSVGWDQTGRLLRRLLPNIDSMTFVPLVGNKCVRWPCRRLPVYMHARLAYGESPFITQSNASLIITGYRDCDCMDILLLVHLVIEVQIHSHEVSKLQLVKNIRATRWSVYLPFVESHELCNESFEMEYDFLCVYQYSPKCVTRDCTRTLPFLILCS